MPNAQIYARKCYKHFVCINIFFLLFFLNKQLNHSKNKYIIRIIETDSDAVYKPRLSHSEPRINHWATTLNI